MTAFLITLNNTLNMKYNLLFNYHKLAGQKAKVIFFWDKTDSYPSQMT